jgi:DNA-binding LacI/PurR family transcriptional regulator
VNRYIGISNAARAAGVSAACISRVLNGLSHTSNALVHRAIKKYETIVEVPEIDAEKELENLARRLK